MKQTHLIFPGQGSQFVGMGHDFFNQFETAKQRFNQADELLGYSISDICFTGPEETLNQTQYTQVAIFIASACIYDQIATLDLNISSYAISDIAHIIPHQANIRILENIAEKFNIPFDRFLTNIDLSLIHI